MPLCCISIEVVALGLICSVEVAILHIIDIAENPLLPLEEAGEEARYTSGIVVLVL